MIRFGASLVPWLIATAALAADWPQWRGPEQTGMSRENAVVTKWSQDGANQLWKVPIGGRACPVVFEGRVFAICPVGEGGLLGERVVCLDTDSGKLLWEHRFNVFHSDIVENRVGFTAPAVDVETGYVFVHGTGGELFCYDRDGKIVWKHSLTEQFGRVSGYGGRLHTPIVDENRVIISMTCSSWGEYAKPAHRFYAFDKKTGTPLWSAAPGGPPTDTTCACPTVAVIGGRRLIIAPNVDGSVYAMLARTGETVWSYKFSRRPLNTMPVVDGDLVYLTHSEENFDTTEMGRVVCLKATGAGELSAKDEVWRVNSCEVGYAAPAIARGRLYVVDNSADLHCLDAATGKTHWTHDLGNLGKGSPAVTADGVIYVGAQEENGEFWILRDAGDKCEVLDHKVFPRTEKGLDEVLGCAAIAGGRVFFQTRYNFYCLGVKDAKVTEQPAVPLPPDKSGEGEQLATTLLTPCEITLAPGEKGTIQASAWTNYGRSPAEVFTQNKPTFTLAGVKGTWDEASSTFTAAPDAAYSAGVLKCKWVGEKEAIARIRICPKLPLAVDFESMAVDSTPPGWLNVASKTKIVDQNGNKVLQKLAERPSPPFMRIRAFMLPPIAGGYTVEADMMGTSRKTPVAQFWPDMGLINSRYELKLMGNTPDAPFMRLVAWDSIPRLQVDAPLAWQPGIWYRMKFQVKLEGDKALLRGKIWARDENEPAAWSIEATDPFPNREGSPGLYAYSNGTTEKSKGSEVFFDNVKVTTND